MPKRTSTPAPEPSQAPAVQQWDLHHPASNYRMATDIAGLCKEIVVKSAINIAGKKYIRAEGWQAIAVAHGCVASARDVERVEGGVRAIGEVRKVSDGTCISTGEGFVGDDEPLWQKRPEYAKRAMCQTRAISRACRSAFAHVAVLMDAGLSTTPAEEVPEGGFKDEDDKLTAYEEDRQQRARAVEKEQKAASAPAKPAPEAPVRPASASKPAPSVETAEPTASSKDGGDKEGLDKQGWHDVVIHFGKNKGIRLGDLEPQQLRWYQKEWQPRPFRGRVGDQDAALREALDESIGKAITPKEIDEKLGVTEQDIQSSQAGTDGENTPYVSGGEESAWKSHQIKHIAAKTFNGRRLDDLDVPELENLLNNWILKVGDKIKLNESKKQEALFVLEALKFHGYSEEKIQEGRKILGS